MIIWTACRILPDGDQDSGVRNAVRQAAAAG